VLPGAADPIDLARKAVALDPINPAARVQLAVALVIGGRYDEARAECRRVGEINPAAMFAQTGEGFIYAAEGKYADALNALAPGASDWSSLFVIALAQFGLGNRAEADAALDKLVRNNADTAAIQIGTIYAFRNEPDAAFEWLERARAQCDPGLATLAGTHLFSNLHGDPRWKAFWLALGISPKVY
jgi:serine/threonine-protein kinase